MLQGVSVHAGKDNVGAHAQENLLQRFRLLAGTAYLLQVLWWCGDLSVQAARAITGAHAQKNLLAMQAPAKTSDTA